MRTHAGMFDVSHMGEVEVEGPGALAFLQRVLSNDVAEIELGGAQYSCLCNEERRRARRPLRLPARRRPLPDRHQLGQPRGRPRLARALEPRLRRRRPRRRRPLRDARRAGPARPRRSSPRTLGIELPPRMRVAAARIGGRPALVCGTGYTGEDGVELLIDPEVAPAIWAELLDAGVVPCGLGARDTLRLEVCFHLHGNDLSPGAQPDRGRARLVLRGGDRLRRLPRRSPGRAPRAPPRSWPRSRSRAPASRARATRSSPAASRSASSPAAPSRPRWRSGSGWPTCAPTSPSPGPRSRSTCAASAAPPG